MKKQKLRKPIMKVLEAVMQLTSPIRCSIILIAVLVLPGEHLVRSVSVEHTIAPGAVDRIHIPEFSWSKDSGLSLKVEVEPPGSPGELSVGGGGGVLHASTSFLGTFHSLSLDLDQSSSLSSSVSLCFNSSSSTLTSDTTVVVFSSSKHYQLVKVTIVENDDFILVGKSELSIDFHDESAKILKLQTDSFSDNYLLQIENSVGCLTVGISQDRCPWNDAPRTIQNSLLHTKILSLGYFPLESELFKDKTLILVLIPLHKFEDCQRLYTDKRSVELKLSKISKSYKYPVLVTILTFIIPSVFSGILLSLFWNQKKKNAPKSLEEKEDVLELEYKGDEAPENDEEMRKKVSYLPDAMVRFSQSEWHRKTKSVVYLYLIPLLGVFYIVPAAQLVNLQSKGV